MAGFAQAAVIPITGYPSDRLGSNRVWLASVAFFTVGPTIGGFLTTYYQWPAIFTMAAA